MNGNQNQNEKGLQSKLGFRLRIIDNRTGQVLEDWPQLHLREVEGIVSDFNAQRRERHQKITGRFNAWLHRIRHHGQAWVTHHQIAGIVAILDRNE